MLVEPTRVAYRLSKSAMHLTVGQHTPDWAHGIPELAERHSPWEHPPRSCVRCCRWRHCRRHSSPSAPPHHQSCRGRETRPNCDTDGHGSTMAAAISADAPAMPNTVQYKHSSSASWKVGNPHTVPAFLSICPSSMQGLRSAQPQDGGGQNKQNVFRTLTWSPSPRRRSPA